MRRRNGAPALPRDGTPRADDAQPSRDHDARDERKRRAPATPSERPRTKPRTPGPQARGREAKRVARRSNRAPSQRRHAITAGTHTRAPTRRTQHRSRRTADARPPPAPSMVPQGERSHLRRGVHQTRSQDRDDFGAGGGNARKRSPQQGRPRTASPNEAAGRTPPTTPPERNRTTHRTPTRPSQEGRSKRFLFSSFR